MNFGKRLLSHIVQVKGELHQDVEASVKTKREKAEDFAHHSRIQEDLEQEILLAIRQAKKKA